MANYIEPDFKLLMLIQEMFGMPDKKRNDKKNIRKQKLVNTASNSKLNIHNS